MNLVDLITRKDKLLLDIGTDLSLTKSPWLNEGWRAVVIPESETPQLVLKNLNRVYALSCTPTHIGWFASCNGKGMLTVSLSSNGQQVQTNIELIDEPRPVRIPWPMQPGFLNETTTLSLHFRMGANTTGRLLIHRLLNRANLISMARGHGVEIGPGPNPQIHQSDIVDVQYVEESPQQEWVEKYDQHGKYSAAQADFSKYTIGTAWNLPQPDASLDFLFSSHVFEHLANPIGHLLRWKSKLKPGGSILAVVPDLNCTFDYMAKPSALDEFTLEHSSGIMAPEPRHYHRWASLKEGRVKQVDAFIKEGVSIHVHYYTPQSMSQLLEECVIKHGFNAFQVIHSQNHKDFHFVLQ